MQQGRKDLRVHKVPLVTQVHKEPLAPQDQQELKVIQDMLEHRVLQDPKVQRVLKVIQVTLVLKGQQGVAVQPVHRVRLVMLDHKGRQVDKGLKDLLETRDILALKVPLDLQDQQDQVEVQVI